MRGEAMMRRGGKKGEVHCVYCCFAQVLALRLGTVHDALQHMAHYTCIRGSTAYASTKTTSPEKHDR